MKTKYLKQLFKTTALALVVSSSMQSFAAPTDEVVAIVDNSVILKSDLDQGVTEATHQLEAQKKGLPSQNFLQRQVLDQLILREAQLEMVKRYNIKIDENTLNDAVLKVAGQSGIKSLPAFQQKLDGIAPGTYAALRARISQDLAINRLRQQQVMSRIKISDQDVENFLKSPQGQAMLGSQVHVIHARISAQQGVDPQQLAKVAQDVKQALNESNDIAAIGKKFSTKDVKVEGADMGYRDLADLPSELAARVSPLQQGQTTELINVRDGIHVLKLIERKSSDQKAMVTQYQTRHILIQPSEVISPDMAKQTIDSIYNRLKSGEDFTTLAATYSSDTGSARDGGSLGWVTPGSMVPQFEEKMKNTPVGQISQPFQTQYGWHILEVTGVREKDMTQEYQERMARQILGERQFDSELDSWLREVRAHAYVQIKDPELDTKLQRAKAIAAQ
ncbi:peptidylprolyl isomerase [uncultured Acinetobacter sp.]|uniref:peptidylprolyl isomerase n=1 Tax=uncultured Acinetobacter sp. TaxID=165433 RepID=UPI00258BD295|nr:peptidylprolyl isomerase [uncultured Acinetobacter sp.]